MDIDLSVLRIMERERDIPFDELVAIIEQAIHTAYLKHVGQIDDDPVPIFRLSQGPSERDWSSFLCAVAGCLAIERY